MKPEANELWFVHATIDFMPKKYAYSSEYNHDLKTQDYVS
jgi:hypothetical protein